MHVNSPVEPGSFLSRSLCLSLRQEAAWAASLPVAPLRHGFSSDEEAALRSGLSQTRGRLPLTVCSATVETKARGLFEDKVQLCRLDCDYIFTNDDLISEVLVSSGAVGN